MAVNSCGQFQSEDRILRVTCAQLKPPVVALEEVPCSHPAAFLHHSQLGCDLTQLPDHLLVSSHEAESDI